MVNIKYNDRNYGDLIIGDFDSIDIDIEYDKKDENVYLNTVTILSSIDKFI